jgi:hypothetical protein
VKPPVCVDLHALWLDEMAAPHVHLCCFSLQAEVLELEEHHEDGPKKRRSLVFQAAGHAKYTWKGVPRQLTKMYYAFCPGWGHIPSQAVARVHDHMMYKPCLDVLHFFSYYKIFFSDNIINSRPRSKLINIA